MKKRTKWILGSLGLLGVAGVFAGGLIYKTFLPPVKKEKGYYAPDTGVPGAALPGIDEKEDRSFEKTDGVWPYALLLGCPSRDDGSYSTSQIRRCNLAIDAYEKGLFDKLIISGGAVKNRYVEAKQMEKYIRENCKLPMEIITETNAKSTWENLKNTRLMIGDKPLLILTSSLHARRAAAMASHSFSRFSVLGYPDYRPKHIVRELLSRLIYIRLEIKKFFALA